MIATARRCVERVAARPVAAVASTPPVCSVYGGRHISAIDWAGIAQRMADALPPGHPARGEFDVCAANSEIIDLPDGGSVTVLAGRWAADARS